MRLAGVATMVVLACTAAGGSVARAAPAPAVLGSELARGSLTVTDVGADHAAARAPRRADGNLDDWTGTRTGFAAAATYSHGEYVYEDHIWDAYGAAGPDGAARAASLDAAVQADPDLYRSEAVALYAPTGTNYGAGPLDYAADLVEVRVAASPSDIAVLVRTTVMTADEQAAVLVLADTAPGGVPRPVPFASGLTTTRAEVALLLAGGRGVAVDLATGRRSEFPVAVRPDGYDNAIEASVPRELLVGPAPADRLRVAVAAGRLDPATGELAARAGGPAVANVAFRAEPARPTFEKLQALALESRTIDAFFADVDLARMAAGVTQAVAPRPGYHDRILVSNPGMSRERDRDGIYQHYGVYVPNGYSPGRPTPTTFFLHGSGNDAHDLPAVIPGLMRALGDERGSLVITPKGRTGFSLWVGAGLVDVLEVWADARRAFDVDSRATTLTGYSMGGIGTFLIASLLPDRFAAAFSIAGPVGGDVISPGVGLMPLPDVRRLFGNLRGVPLLMYQGGADNNVPPTNGFAAADALARRGYRHRLLTFPADNHFSPGAVDRWAEAVQYLAAFPRLDPDPRRVSYARDMPFERAVDRGEMSDQTLFPESGTHGLRFDRAYWMSELTPADTDAGVASIDARSLAIPARAIRTRPENAAGATPDAYVQTGLGWTAHGPAPRRANRFTATLTGATAVRLDTGRMRLDPRRRIVGRVRTQLPLELRLSGRWRSGRPLVTWNGRALDVVRDRSGIVLRVPPGTGTLVISARG